MGADVSALARLHSRLEVTRTRAVSLMKSHHYKISRELDLWPALKCKMRASKASVTKNRWVMLHACIKKSRQIGSKDRMTYNQVQVATSFLPKKTSSVGNAANTCLRKAKDSNSSISHAKGRNESTNACSLAEVVEEKPVPNSFYQNNHRAP